MPQPVQVVRSGTGWTIDVSSLQLSSNLADKDFLIFQDVAGGGVSFLNKANVTKTTQGLLTYTGASIPASPVSTFRVFRDTSFVFTNFSFGQINSSTELNARLAQIQRCIEDQRYLSGLPVG